MKKIYLFGLIITLIFTLSVGSVAATGFFDNFFAKNNQVTGYVIDETLEWTPWLNRDHPSGTGDWETTSDFQKSGQLLCDPVAIECVTLAGDNWDTTDDAGYICTVKSGGICKNENQANTPDNYCEDYKVRFACAPKLIDESEDNESEKIEENTSISCVDAGYICTSAIAGCGLDYKEKDFDCFGDSMLVCCDAVSYCGDGICDDDRDPLYAESSFACPEDCEEDVIVNDTDEEYIELAQELYVEMGNPYSLSVLNGTFLIEVVGGTNDGAPDGGATVILRISNGDQKIVKSLEEDDERTMLGVDIKIKDIDADNYSISVSILIIGVDISEMIVVDVINVVVDEFFNETEHNETQVKEDEEEPIVCCQALTASCLACASGQTVEEFCFDNQEIIGCENYVTKEVDDGIINESKSDNDFSQDYCVDTDQIQGSSVNYDVQGSVAASNFDEVKTDYCQENKVDWLVEYYCAGNKGKVTERKCPFGCEEGICLSKDANENRTMQAQIANSYRNTLCDGCQTEEACVPYGIRMNGTYCALSKEFKNFKDNEEFCENNFECSTNLCIDDACVSKSFLNKLREFLQKWF